MPQIMQIELSDPPVLDGDEVRVDAGKLLSPRQEIAMQAMLSGRTQRAAAMIAGVAEETVSRWMASDTTFIQYYALRRADVHKAFETRIMRLVDRALAAIEDLMLPEQYVGTESYNPNVRLAAAQTALKMAGLLPSSTRINHFGSGQLNIGEQQVNLQKAGE